MKTKGNASGRNHEVAGFVNNTYQNIQASGEDPNRHCTRATYKGTMKCIKCYDYNKGVRLGQCIACQFERFAVSDDPGLDFERRIEQNHRWSHDEILASGLNTQLIYRVVREVLGGDAVVTKEGSTRKCTHISSSDIDLMITLGKEKPMTEENRQDLADALQCPQFQNVSIAKHAIKITPYTGRPIDIVAHHSDFHFKYLKPAERDFFWKNPAAAQAVAGLKIWWGWTIAAAEQEQTAVDGSSSIDRLSNSQKKMKVLVSAAEEGLTKVSGFGWEQFVMKTGLMFPSGLEHFIACMQLLACDGKEACAGTEMASNKKSAIHLQNASRKCLSCWNETHDLQMAFGM